MVFKGKNPGPHLVSLVRNCCTVVGGRGQGLFPQTQKGLLFMGEGKCLEMAFSLKWRMSRQTTAEGKK